MTALLDAALALNQAGCCIVPARPDGTKAPATIWKQYQAVRPPVEQIEAWLSNGTYDGFGIICGSVSASLEMIEFEGRAVADRLHVTYSDTLDAHGLLPLWQSVIGGYTEVTPSGGLHILYRVDGQVRGNTKLARNAAGEVLMETRGEGGFTIVAPSGGRTHPSGKAWQIAAGGPATIVTITEEERDALHAIASLLDQSPPPPVLSWQHQDILSETGRPGDDFNARASWEQILTPHGWTCIRAFGQDAHGWRRPGKNTPGISATTRDNGGLYVFSTSTPFDIETPYSKFAAYALLEHGGDYSAAAARLRRDGYGDQRPPDTGINDLINPQPKPGEAGDPTETGDDLVALAGIAAQYAPVDWHQAWLDQPEDTDWLIDGFLERGTVNALFAKPGTGKSLIALELAVILVRRGLPVVYVDDENRISDLVERLQAFGCTPDELDRLKMYSFAGLPPLDTILGGMHLLALAITHAAELVVLDTTTRMVQGKENDSDTFLQLYRCSLVPLKARAITVLRLDHPGKDAERGQRGSSAKDGDVDTVWRLSAVSGGDSEYQLERTKSRSGHGDSAFVLTRHHAPLRHDWKTGASDHVPTELSDLIARMNDAQIPLTAGRPAVIARFKELDQTVGDTGRLQKAINLRKQLSETDARQADNGASRDLSAVFPLRGRQQDRSEAPDPDTPACKFGVGPRCINDNCRNPNHKAAP